MLVTILFLLILGYAVFYIAYPRQYDWLKSRGRNSGECAVIIIKFGWYAFLVLTDQVLGTLRELWREEDQLRISFTGPTADPMFGDPLILPLPPS